MVFVPDVHMVKPFVIFVGSVEHRETALSMTPWDEQVGLGETCSTKDGDTHAVAAVVDKCVLYRTYNGY